MNSSYKSLFFGVMVGISFFSLFIITFVVYNAIIDRENFLIVFDRLPVISRNLFIFMSIGLTLGGGHTLLILLTNRYSGLAANLGVSGKESDFYRNKKTEDYQLKELEKNRLKFVDLKHKLLKFYSAFFTVYFFIIITMFF